MEIDTVQSYFNSDPVVAHYEVAVQKIGLWKSEEKDFSANLQYRGFDLRVRLRSRADQFRLT